MTRVARDESFVHRSGTQVGEFFHHLTPPLLTCAFVLVAAAGTVFGLLTVEECGVEWSAVE